ncbi:MAG: alpha/beta hydrolase [Bdellovibrionaceae bacterium]|nr:alpha/beta hydrolase [Pseudobdellovibrionaceae bacterium]
MEIQEATIPTPNGELKYRLTQGQSHQTLIFMHGLPGPSLHIRAVVDRLVERLGWNGLSFHYRGCWGSTGEYALTKQHEDYVAVCGWLKEVRKIPAPAQMTLGYSMGGYNLLRALSEGRVAGKAIALAPLTRIEGCGIDDAFFEEASGLLEMPPVKLKSQYALLPAIDFAKVDKEISPLLSILTAAEDELFSEDYYQQQFHEKARSKWTSVPRANHLFEGVEKELEEGLFRLLSTTN